MASNKQKSLLNRLKDACLNLLLRKKMIGIKRSKAVNLFFMNIIKN